MLTSAVDPGGAARRGRSGRRFAGLRSLGMLLLLLPGLAAAQAFRCAEPGTGAVLYTDQSCAGGVLVVPERSAEQARVDTDRALDARQRQLQREATVLQLQQDRLQRDRDRLARERAELHSERAACREARDEAARQAASADASAEQVRIARDNAALACGQPLPREQTVVVRQVQPYGYAAPRHPPGVYWRRHRRRHGHAQHPQPRHGPAHAWGWRRNQQFSSQAGAAPPSNPRSAARVQAPVLGGSGRLSTGGYRAVAGSSLPDPAQHRR